MAQAVAVVVLDAVESVCMITAPYACTDLPALKRHADLESWACKDPAPQLVIRDGHMRILHLTQYHTRGRQRKPARCAVVFLFSRILFRPGPEPLTQ